MQLPPPQPISIWEVIRLPDCKLLAQGHHYFRKQCPCGSTVTSISHHFGSVAQSEEQPVVCGKAEGASPFGSANFKSYRKADSQGFGLAFLHSDVSKSRPELSARSVAATHSAWDRGIAGATPAALTIFRMDGLDGCGIESVFFINPLIH